MLCAVACGSLPPPNDQAAATRKVVDQADALKKRREAIRAENVPEADLHLKMANDQIATAEKLISEEEMGEARLVLQRAEADAELAEALFWEAEMRDKATEARGKVDKLKKQ
jgi:hypothetical protein